MKNPQIHLINSIKKVPPHIQEKKTNKTYPGVLAANLIYTWPKDLKDEDLCFFNMICRKINVTKGVLEYYESDWRKPEETILLSPQSWTFIIAALLSYPPDNNLDQGQNLKHLNAVFSALDFINPNDNVPYLEDLKSWAENKLNLTLAK